jgi:thiol-disulfide isomerase/thioredoxin
MYINLKISLLIQFILYIAFTNLSFAENVTEQCNFERKSPGSWYGDVNMIGPVDRKGFSSPPYSKWFVTEYKDYQPNVNVIEDIKKNDLPDLNELKITVFMGTWCSDSKKQIPRLYKILDQINFNEDSLSVHAVGIVPKEFRKTHNGIAEKGRNIYRVPTIIVTRNKQELGRIVEFPNDTLEQDVLNILLGANYIQANYILEGEVNDYLEKKGLNGFEKTINLMAKEFTEKGIKEDELNHYIAYNLLYAKRYREAALVTKMMIVIFPEAGHLHMTLARIYEFLNNDYLALSSYQKAFHYVEDEGKLAIIRGAISRSQEFK